MPSAREFVAKAASQIGTKENPAGSNIVPYWEWYGEDLQGNPWCACFVSWCAAQVGALDLTGKFAYCPSWVNWAKEHGLWLDREEKPQHGDIVFFGNGNIACHVGIVETRNGSSSVTTIEGNTSQSSNDNGGSVMRRKRGYGERGSRWWIMGFLRPKWDEIGVSVPVSEPSSPTTAAKDNWVLRLQQECNRQGFSNQAEDGIPGRNTLAGCPTLGRRSKGGITKLMQERLIALGYSCGSCGADGENGTDTNNAVRAFQRDNGLDDDAVCGQKTWKALLGL